jgi:methanogenic corrinoid protein MtbC1
VLGPLTDAYREAVLDTDRDRALAVVNDALSQGVSPEDIVFKVVVSTIETVFQSATQSSELSLAQHFMASQISNEVVEAMIPRFQQRPESVGRIVIGTSHGDFHGLGKSIVAGFLKAQMVGVTDLGLNVPARRFVDEALKQEAEVIGISSMMVHTARGEQGCVKVRQILRERDLENRIKIVVGGAPYRFDEQLYEVVGADAYGKDALSANAVVCRLIQEVHGQ